MKLERKKSLVSRTLGLGKSRIMFNNARLSEVKEAITKQDVRDLVKDGAILIRPVLGRRKIVRRKYRRTAGKVRMRVIDKKARYIRITRKLRNYLFQLRFNEKISKENYLKLRREIRASNFKDLSHFKERISQLKWKAQTKQ